MKRNIHKWVQKCISSDPTGWDAVDMCVIFQDLSYQQYQFQKKQYEALSSYGVITFFALSWQTQLQYNEEMKELQAVGSMINSQIFQGALWRAKASIVEANWDKTWQDNHLWIHAKVQQSAAQQQAIWDENLFESNLTGEYRWIQVKTGEYRWIGERRWEMFSQVLTGVERQVAHQRACIAQQAAEATQQAEAARQARATHPGEGFSLMFVTGIWANETICQHWFLFIFVTSRGLNSPEIGCRNGSLGCGTSHRNHARVSGRGWELTCSDPSTSHAWTKSGAQELSSSKSILVSICFRHFLWEICWDCRYPVPQKTFAALPCSAQSDSVHVFGEKNHVFSSPKLVAFLNQQHLISCQISKRVGSGRQRPPPHLKNQEACILHPFAPDVV